MGILDFLNSGKRFDLDPDYTEQAIRHALRESDQRIMDLEESLLEVADAFDNIGWSGGLAQGDAVEMPLATVKNVAKIARAVEAVNPFVKKGVESRISYVWSGGVEFKNLEKTSKKLIESNRKRLFSPQAYEEQERALATDGNVFRAVSRSDKPIIRIPLDQIVGRVSNPDNQEEVWYYKREWETKRTLLDDGSEKVETKILYYPSMGYAKYLEDHNQGLPKRLAKFGVDQDYVVQHVAVNKQIGWSWGIPDIMPVIFFAKVYKEYLEDNVTLVKAYSRIAYQVQATSAGVANSAAAAYAKAPMRDPITGESLNIGGMAVTNTDTNLIPTALNASAVDFDSGEALAVAIAAGLQVSKTDVLPDGTPGAMPVTTLKAMSSRQQVWGEAFAELFEFWDDKDVEVTWGQIDEDETHRRVQSVQLAYDGGLLFQQEARDETLKTLKMVPGEESGLPVAPEIQAAEKAAETAQKVAESQPAKVPGQGVNGAVGSINSGRGQVEAAAKKSMTGK